VITGVEDMKIGIVADDLTGANATGVRLTKEGFTSATIVYSNEIPHSHPLEAVSIDTDSRYAADEVVVERVQRAMNSFEEWGAKIICKRIDSTARGKIGLEIDTVLNELGENSVAIVVAAFPDSDRITSGGYLLVDSLPVQETDVAKDPLKPIEESYIPAIIAENSKNKISHIGLNSVLRGEEALQKSLEKHIEQNNRIIVVDAVTEENIEVIAEAMASIEMNKSSSSLLVPVDPGPLTAFYASALSHRTTEIRKIIATIGSITSLSGKQLHYLVDKTHSSPVYVSAKKLASLGSSWDEEVNRSVKNALARIEEDDVLIITTYADNEKLVDLAKVAKEENTTQDALAKRITNGLAKITRLVMNETSYAIQGCFTSGGDVTASLVAETEASGIRLEEEVMPLTAYGTMIGGHFPDLPMVTKGGMVGDKRSIFTSVRYLKTKRSGI